MRTATLDRLANSRFDILIIGGGIHGAFAAWDAALRGFQVALIDRGDFGGATSANSLKIAHGGIRHLQRLDIVRLKRSHYERTLLQRMAPHLVHDLPCVAPTASGVRRGRMAAAFAAHMAGILRSDSRARVLDSSEYRSLAGRWAIPDATGGMLWYDGQIASPDRLLIEIVLAAEHQGACVANYVEAQRLVRDAGGVKGACVRADDATIDVRASVVLLAANDGAPRLLRTIGLERAHEFALACNVVLRAAPPSVASALPSPNGARLLFAVPWRGHVLLGTSQHHADMDPARAVCELIGGLRAALPACSLGIDDVTLVHRGLLPGTPQRLQDTPVVCDHASSDHVPGLVTLTGTKWTTARHTAELALNVCARQLGSDVRHCRTHEASLRAPPTPAHSLAARVVRAIHHEFARHLDDIVLRRTGLGAAGHPGTAELTAAAQAAAGELGWSSERTAAEIERVEAYYPATATAAAATAR